MTLLTVTGLSHHYHRHGFNNDAPRPVLHDISLSLQAGETVALLGRSGCGKSTLARLLVGLERPAEGSVLWQGHDIHTLRGDHAATFRRDIQLVFQDAPSAVNPRMTVREIVREPLRHLFSLSRAEQETRIVEMMQAVELDAALLGARPNQLSGGQLQRVCLARALITHPKLLILDEAVSNLDLVLQATIITLLKQLQAKLHTSFLFITHDVRLVKQFCQRVMIMEEGRIVENATVNQDFVLQSDAGLALQQAVLPAYPVRPALKQAS